MTRLFGALLAASVLVIASPAMAKWKLVENGQDHAVAKSEMVVTPSDAWNRNTKRPIKRSEIWTIDGVTLNELYFVGGIGEAEPVFRQVDKKRNPLPGLRAGMLLTDIPEFYESSTRVALNATTYQTTLVEPAQFLGQPAVRFAYEFSVADSPLVKKGLAIATLINGSLYMIAYTAPALHYFDRDLAKVEALMASARI